MLRQESTINNSCLLDIVPMPRRRNVSNTEVIGTARQVVVRIRRAHAPITRIIITGIVDIDGYMLRLILLDGNHQMITAI